MALNFHISAEHKHGGILLCCHQGLFTFLLGGEYLDEKCLEYGEHYKCACNIHDRVLLEQHGRKDYGNRKHGTAGFYCGLSCDPAL